MVKNRNSVRKLGEQLSEIVINGGGSTAKATEIAVKLNALTRQGGVYTKRYDDHEERVLMRHLNLYINKRNKAVSDIDRARWQGKIGEQEAKIAEFRQRMGSGDFDLDGL